MEETESVHVHEVTYGPLPKGQLLWGLVGEAP